jgi:hypothetical protein
MRTKKRKSVRSSFVSIRVHSWLFLSFLLCTTGCEATRSVTGLFTGKTPLAAVRQMEDTSNADERRIGIYRLSNREFGRREPYTKRFRQIAEFDPDYTVRVAAIRALNRSRDQEATPVFIKALNDPNPWVRMEAAKALANIPDEKAIEPLKKLVTDSNQAKDVRLHAADALRHYHTLDVARVLVDRLDERDFSVAWMSLRSLKTMTGADYHYDEAAWLGYITGPTKPFG